MLRKAFCDNDRFSRVLNCLTRKASNHRRGFESQKLVRLLLFVDEIDFRFVCFFRFSFFFFFFFFFFISNDSFMYLTHVNIRPIQHHDQADTKDAREISAAGVLGK